jgi:hypothetical protein
MKSVALALAPMLLAACTGESTLPVSAPISQTTPLRVPVTAHLIVTQASPGRTVLTARIERHVRFASDLEVHVTVPPGVRVIGPTDWTSRGTSEAAVDERTLEVEYDGVPPADLELTATVQGTAFGLTARDAYRFGRAAPEPAPRVRAEGPHLVVGGRDYGPSVPLAK